MIDLRRFYPLLLITSVFFHPHVANAAPLSKKITQRVTESAVDSALDALNTPENQHKLESVLTSPALTHSARLVTLSIVNAVIDGVKERTQGQSESFAS